MNKDVYKKVINEMPYGYALHKIVLNDKGIPFDYTYIEVNDSFSKQTGKNIEDIVGKNVLKLFPGIEKDVFNWIGFYGNIAINQGSDSFESYSTPLDKWYRVYVYSPEKDYFVTLSSEITSEKKELAKKESLIAMMNDIVLELDVDYHITEVIANKIVDPIINTEGIIGKRIHDIFPNDLVGQTLLALQNVYISKEREIFEYSKKEKGNKRIFLVEIHYTKKDIFGFYLIAIKDITKEKQLTLDIQMHEEKYQNIFRYVPVGIFHFDKNGVTTDCNDLFVSIIGSTKKDLVGLNNLNLPDKLVVECIKGALNGQVTIYEGIYHATTSNKVIPLSAKFAPIYSLNKEIIGGTGIVEDITNRKMAEEKLMYSSIHDSMTSLHNRSFFDAELIRLDKKENMPLTIVMSDVNGLKLVNDSFGHIAGNKLLIKAAETIKSCCRDNDIVARIGGDEFGLILPRTDEINAQKIISIIKDKLENTDMENMVISISFGYSTKYSEEVEMKGIIAEAENYMYKRKMYESQSMRNKTIDVIMNTLFEKSEREMLHSKRVSSICGTLASELGLDKDDINRIKIAALVHDIGKIGIDEKILNKPGRLDDTEWVEIKKHPESSWRILASSLDFSELARDVLYHHERWDGKGYPEGLKGEEIPIQARIITVADAYDAMTSDRPYRKGMSKEEALDEIKKCSGTQFDPRIVDVFLKKIVSKSKEL